MYDFYSINVYKLQSQVLTMTTFPFRFRFKICLNKTFAYRWCKQIVQTKTTLLTLVSVFLPSFLLLECWMGKNAWKFRNGEETTVNYGKNRSHRELILQRKWNLLCEKLDYCITDIICTEECCLTTYKLFIPGGFSLDGGRN